MNLLLGALSEGFIFALLALGLFLSYRVFEILDLTVDGSFGVGAATTAALLVRGVSPLGATLLGICAGAAAGLCTGTLHTWLRLNPSLSGVLVTTALYSVILLLLKGGNLSLASTESLVSLTARVGERLLRLTPSTTLFGSSVGGESVSTLAAVAVLALMMALGLTRFLRTELGLAMRAAGSNPQMARSLAIDVDRKVVLGLVLSNGIIALSGAIYVQYQGFANIQMGIGAVVTGLAILMLGEALTGRRTLDRWIAGAVAGAVGYRLIIAAAIRAGLGTDALRLVTALLVLLVLLLPRVPSLVRRLRVIGRVPAHG